MPNPMLGQDSLGQMRKFTRKAASEDKVESRIGVHESYTDVKKV